jgi:hypothetical protein
MKQIIFILFLLVQSGISLSQSSLSVRIITLSTHPFADVNLNLHENPIDNSGYLTFEPGLIVSYDRYIKNKWSFRLSTAVFNDRFNQLSGYSQVFIKYKLFKIFKHSLYAGFGPAVHYTTDRSAIEGYVNDENYSSLNNVMYKISMLSGLIEYNYLLTKELDFAIALNHIHPESIALSIGIRFDLPDPNGKGCNCPGYR